MAEEESEEAGGPPPAPGGTRIVWFVIGALLVLFIAIGVASKKSTPKPFKPEGSRAVVVPTLDRQRTVVVPPCSPPTVIDAANAGSQLQVPGAVAVTLPRGPAARTVVVPRCSAAAAPSPGAANVPSAAFVLGADEQVSDRPVAKGGDPVAAEIKRQLTVPTGSPAAVVVVPPCQGTAQSPGTTVLAPPAGSTVAVAGAC